MKLNISLLFLLVSKCLFAQTIVESYKTISQVNDNIWLISAFNVYESEIPDSSEVRIDTVLVPEETLYFDSVGIIRHIAVTTFNRQNEIAAKISEAFDAIQSSQQVSEANVFIDNVSRDSSNYFEETAKEFSDDLVGRYRVHYDSSGVRMNTLADMELISNAAHPDGRLMRLTFDDGRFFTVQVYHRWRLRIVNWPFGEDKFSWHRSFSSPLNPLYRPEDYNTSDDRFTRIKKLR